jgi:hypothetical protein
VKVTDQSGHAVSGVTVRFTLGVTSGGITTPATTTAADGTATPDSWRLSSVAGTNTLTATVDRAHPSSVTFSATSVPAGTAGYGTRD